MFQGSYRGHIVTATSLQWRDQYDLSHQFFISRQYTFELLH